jgi:uncharacterized membrane protein YeaQ/YmgE (transglycosylase-associated protein family)
MKESTMHVLWMLLIGLIVGALAKLIMPGRDPGGVLVTMLLGVAGSLIAGFIGHVVGWYGSEEAAGFFASLAGAILILAVYRLVIRRREPTSMAGPTEGRGG